MTHPFDSAAMIARVRVKVMEAVSRETSALHRTIRAEAGGWEPVAPGVERRLLWERGEAASCMVRVAPGTSFPCHNHAIDEECVILQGSLQIGDVLLRPGDFHVGLSGVEHETVSSQDGCLCFLRTAKSFFEPA